MAELFTHNPKFTTRYLLTIRSPLKFTQACVQIALRFAVLGMVDEAVDLLELADSYVPIASRQVHDLGLYFAFQAADWWPDFTPDEEMHDEDLLLSLEDNTVFLLPGILRLDHTIDDERKIIERKDLDAVIEYLHEAARQKAREAPGGQPLGIFVLSKGSGESKADMRAADIPRVMMAFDSAVFFALHFALKLDDKTALDTVIAIIKRDIERYIRKLALFRPAWSVLVKGILGPAPEDKQGKENLKHEYERIKNAIRRRLRNGVEYPFLDHSMSDIVKMLKENSARHHDPGRSSTDTAGGVPITDFPPATKQFIENLEDRLGVLPDDYKDFLRVCTGMQGLWNGQKHQQLLGNAHHLIIEDSSLSLPPLFSLIPRTELSRNFTVVWPPLEPQYYVQLNFTREAEVLCLIPAWQIRVARDVLMNAMRNGREGPEKIWVDRVVRDYFGELEELGGDLEGEDEDEGRGWGVAYWDGNRTPVEVWGSFREWIESAVIASEMPDVMLEKEKSESH